MTDMTAEDQHVLRGPGTRVERPFLRQHLPGPSANRQPASAPELDATEIDSRATESLPRSVADTHTGVIAVYLPGLYGGGAERTVLNVARGIADRGYEVDLVVSQFEGELAVDVPDRVRLVRLDRLGSRKYRTIRTLPSLVRYLRTRRPRVLFSALFRANLTAVAARFVAGVNTRVVVSERNTLSVTTQRFSTAKRRFRLASVRLGYRLADHVVAVSEGVADDLRTEVGLSKVAVSVIYNPVVTSQLREKCKDPVDHPWLQPSIVPVVLAVGSLTVQKDFVTLIRAFALARATRACRLLILGEGPEREQLEAETRALGVADDVDLPGWVPNPYPYMQAATVFALSSRWEGLPGVLIEALYCGSSIVSTDCPSGPREILQDGRYGELVPLGNPRALADGILAGIDKPRLTAGSERYERFTDDTVIDQYLQVLLREAT